MTTQIRHNVFETNSSSSHSITVGGEVMADFGISEQVLRDGVMDITLSGEYGWGFDTFSSTTDKLEYLLLLAIDSYPSNIESEIENSKQAKRVISVFENTTGLKLNISYDDGYVDHQSRDVADNVLEDEELIKVFLFSKQSYFETGNDNV